MGVQVIRAEHFNHMGEVWRRAPACALVDLAPQATLLPPVEQRARVDGPLLCVRAPLVSGTTYVLTILGAPPAAGAGAERAALGVRLW